MSEVNLFISKLYQYSIDCKFGDAEEVITTHLDFLDDANKPSVIDSILYSIDFNRVSAKLVKYIIYKIGHYDKLIMRKDFIERAMEYYGKDKLL